MAVLSTSDLVALRNCLEKSITPQTYTKPQAHLALQAIEDCAEDNKGVFNAAIEAVAPGVFSVADKKQLFKCWAYSKFKRGG